MGWLRIIAGELRGRRIAVPRGSVRPTSDRAREGLFSILGEVVRGAAVLDAYAGSGALAFEALSRGAARAVLVEADRHALETLRANAERLGVVDRCTVLRGRTVDLARRGGVGGPFGLIFADPPYGGSERGPFLEAATGLLATGGTIVLERDAVVAAVVAAGLDRFRTAEYGRCRFDLYRGAASEAAPGRG